MTEKEILTKIINYIYDNKDNKNSCGYNYLNYNEYTTEFNEDFVADYEKKDMQDFFKEYPYMKIISYGIVLDLQRRYNDEMLCAGWCGYVSPETLVKRVIDNDYSIDFNKPDEIHSGGF